MIIKRIYIDSFGKFQKFELNLDSAFNVIYGNNEDGKSTLMAFVRMMFYGDNSRARAIREKPRELYRPWDSEKMGGTIIFEAEGVTYQLDRSFGKSNTTDKIKITNLAAGTEVQLARNQDPGQLFFGGLGLEAFERSVFIGQSGSLISESGKEDEITQRLLNLVTTADENTSYKKVMANIKTAQEKLQAPRRSSLIGDSLVKLDALRVERDNARQDEQTKRNTMAEIDQKKKDMSKLELRRNLLNSQLRILELDEDYQHLEEALRQRDELDKLIAVKESHLAELKRDDIVLDDAFLTEAFDQLNHLKATQRSLEEATNDYNNENEKLSLLKQEQVREIPEGRTASIRQLERQADETRESLSNTKNEKERLQELIKLEKELEADSALLEQKHNELTEISILKQKLAENYTGISTNKNQIKTKLDNINRQLTTAQEVRRQAELELNNAQNQLKSLDARFELKLEMAQNQLEKASQPQTFQEEVPASRKFKKPGVAASIVIALLAVILGSAIEPLLFLLLIPAVLTFVLSAHKVPARTITRQLTDQSTIKQAEEALRSEESQYQQQKNQAQQNADQLDHKYKQAEAEVASLQTSAGTLGLQIDELEKQLEQADEAHDNQMQKQAAAKAEFDSLKTQYTGKSRAFEIKLRTVAADAADAAVPAEKPEAEAAERNYYPNPIIPPDQPGDSAFTNVDADADDAALVPAEVDLEAKLVELNSCQSELEEKLRQLLNNLKQGLAEFEAEDIDELYNLEKLWNSYQEKLSGQQSAFVAAAAKTERLKGQLQQEKQQLLAHVSHYKTADSLESAIVLLDELKYIIKQLSETESGINSYRSILGETGLMNADELKQKLEEIGKKLQSERQQLETALAYPATVDETLEPALAYPATVDQTLETALAYPATVDQALETALAYPATVDQTLEPADLRKNIIDIDSEISRLASSIASSEGTVREKYRMKRNVSQIENDIEETEDLIARQRQDQEILRIAAEVMEDSFQEVQRSFGPIVNRKTAAIFNTLTNGKYKNVAVSRDFSITVENSGDRTLREWDYLSSGTVDQVYLALRLAITELVAGGREPLPLLLDDIFTLYDDIRAFEGMKFIKTYRQESDRPQQILLFTCHRRIVEWGSSLGAVSFDLGAVTPG